MLQRNTKVKIVLFQFVHFLKLKSKRFSEGQYCWWLGVTLKREEAVLLLREMFEKCTLFDGNYLSLMPPNSAGLLSEGYQIHLKIPIDKQTQDCMKQISEKYNCCLSFINRSGEDVAIIYRPKKT
jgi:hypothetical protein